MKMIYIVCNKIRDYHTIIGVCKKIKMQMDAFEKAGYEPIYICFDSYRLYIQEQGKERCVSMNYYKRPRQCVDAVIDYIRKAAPDLVYIRYSIIWDSWIEYFYQELGMLDTKTVLEFYTYPYDSEIPEGSRQIAVDRYYRRNLKNYFKLSSNFEGVDEIMGIPSVPICNGISADVPIHSVKDKKGKKEINMIAVATVAFWHGLDRVIEGINQYVNVEKNTEWELYLHIVGEGAEIPKIKKMVQDYGLDDKVLFYGKVYDINKLNELFEGKDIGIGSIGMHRHSENMKASPLKSSEYCMRGLPFMIDYYDTQFDNDYPYIMHVSQNEEPVSMHEVIEFSEKYADSHVARNMRDYAIENLSWDKSVKKIIEFAGLYKNLSD